MSPAREIDVGTLIDRLDRLRPSSGAAAVVFDGDGTLWSGDVAEDVYRHAVARDLFREAAAEPLSDAARRRGLPADGGPSAVAERIFTAYLDGRFPERTVCEVMTWCFAGWSLEELRRLSDEVLVLADLDGRVNRALAPVFDWARQEHVRIVVVSASPRFIVERAAERWNVAPPDIAASTPALEHGRVLPRMDQPVPYAEAKVSQARALLGEAAWLASFGDSPFDLEMMRAAALGVAVQPKPALLARLGEAPNAWVLRP